jgi:hypothetical protein
MASSASSFEHGKKSLDSVKGREFLDSLLKKVLFRGTDHSSSLLVSQSGTPLVSNLMRFIITSLKGIVSERCVAFTHGNHDM